MIARSNLRARFKVLCADDESGEVDLEDIYTISENSRLVRNRIRSRFCFRDGLIVEQIDTCNALWWGIQARGPMIGVITWLVPPLRRRGASKKLAQFIDDRSGAASGSRTPGVGERPCPGARQICQ